MKGYKIWNDDAKKCITNRDIAFKEDKIYIGRVFQETNDLSQEFERRRVSIEMEPLVFHNQRVNICNQKSILFKNLLMMIIMV